MKFAWWRRGSSPRPVKLETVSTIPSSNNEVAALKKQVAELMARNAALQRVKVEQVKPKPQFTFGDKFVVAMPFCARDAMAAVDLLRWMRQLNGRPHKIRLLLCAQHGCPDALTAEVRKAAGLAFSEVEYITTSFDLPDEKWPTGTCWMFLHIAKYCLDRRWDFWINEPDCIPVKTGWLDALVAEYMDCGFPYMGFIEPAPTHGGYPRHLAGNACYNWQVYQHFRADKLGVGWDVAMADVLTDQAWHTKLFHQEFGPLDHPPTFKTMDDLARIPSEAMIYHRCKDGSLTRWLRERESTKNDELLPAS